MTGASLTFFEIFEEEEMDQYYKPEHLAHFSQISEGSPKLAEKFFDYYKSVFEDGALSSREKALIALAVSHTVQCPYCIDAYSKESLQQGADLEQMTEAIHVATAIRGGASLVHGLQMLDHVKKSGM
jgi:4-carboxymuconolactone decarboxylase